MAQNFGGNARSRVYQSIKSSFPNYPIPNWRGTGLTLQELNMIKTIYTQYKKHFGHIALPNWPYVTSDLITKYYLKQVDDLTKLKNMLEKEYKENIEKKAKRTENIINDLVNGRINKIEFKHPTKNLIKYILERLQGQGKFVMNLGKNNYYTLNNRTITKLLDNLDELFMETVIKGMSYSDIELMHVLLSYDTVSIERVIGGKQFIEGSRFKYICNLPISLERYQIPTKQEDIYKFEYIENCFVHALRMYGIDNKICDDITLSLKSELLPQKDIKQICEKYKLYVTIKSLTSSKHNRHYGEKSDDEIKIGLIENHYFLIEETKITKEQLRNNCDGTIQNNVTKTIDSYNMIKYICEHKNQYLKPIEQTKREQNDIYNNITDNSNLTYIENNTKVNKYVEKKGDKFVNIFFDSETTTEGTHIPYLFRCADIDIDFTGENGGLRMLRYLGSKYDSIRLIAHNLGYDFKFIYKYLDNIRLIERGKNILHGTAIFNMGNGKIVNIQLQDSYAFLTMKLKDFTQCFGLNDEKEYMPYSMYTQKNIEKRYINIEEFSKYDGYNEFKENCNKWDCINDNKVDIIKYSSKYCAMDCQVLKDGYNKFRENILQVTGLDINNYVSLASIANAYFEKEGVYNNVHQLNGIPREFIQKCVVGGRVMTRNNEKWHVKKELDDFDAVSLYPSAMSRLGGYLIGKPKVLENKTYEFLQSCDGYFVEIMINEVGKNYAFPLVSIIDPITNVRNFTNEVEGKRIYVDKITLEDLIKFQQIKFNIIRGYYYDEGRNMKLGSSINYLFNQRLEAKKNKNPIQNTFKLLMNSSYGKTLLKPYEIENKYLLNNLAENYVKKHFEHIQSFTKLSDNKTTQIKEYTIIDEHFNNVSCGVEVLSMSKRIMNEVMTLAEDMNYNIYYQDTDSMHIESDKVEFLAKAFKNKYNRELIGSNMGNFHCDFTSDKIKKNIKSVESYFLGKKCYIDKLEGQDENNNTVNDFHIRMKGVSNKAIMYENVNPMITYKKLYKGDEIEFDLTCGGDVKLFNYTKSYNIETKEDFMRRIKF